jgi:hypothetical protein
LNLVTRSLAVAPVQQEGLFIVKTNGFEELSDSGRKNLGRCDRTFSPYTKDRAVTVEGYAAGGIAPSIGRLQHGPLIPIMFQYHRDSATFSSTAKSKPDLLLRTYLWSQLTPFDLQFVESPQNDSWSPCERKRNALAPLESGATGILGTHGPGFIGLQNLAAYILTVDFGNILVADTIGGDTDHFNRAGLTEPLLEFSFGCLKPQIARVQLLCHLLAFQSDSEIDACQRPSSIRGFLSAAP